MNSNLVYWAEGAREIPFVIDASPFFDYLNYVGMMKLCMSFDCFFSLLFRSATK
jgi:hypothetical protein